MNAPSQTFSSTGGIAGFARRPRMHSMPAFAVVGATLSTWRARARERAELAAMDARERQDLPHGRDFDLRGEIAKPFWRE